MSRLCSVVTASLLAPLAASLLLLPPVARGADEPSAASRTYENRLTPIATPAPILADHPDYVEPIRETARFEAPTLIDDPGADLSVRAWRFSYNARGIIEMLDLQRPIYTKTAAYGHFGRSEPEFSWEATDKAQALRQAI